MILWKQIFSRDNDGETVSMVTRTLNLIDTTDGDSGMYTCMATNDADPGTATMDFVVIVWSELIIIILKITLIL